jgi:signal transduction histidine kinase
MILIAAQAIAGSAITFIALQDQVIANELKKAKEVSAAANDLMLIVYDAGDAIGRFARARSLDPEETLPDPARVKDKLDLLRKELAQDPQAMQLIANAETNISICLPVLKDSQKMTGKLDDPQIKAQWRQRRDEIQPQVNGLLRDLPQLTQIARRKERTIYETDINAHRRFDALALYGLGTCIILVLILAGGLIFIIYIRLEQLKKAIKTLQPLPTTSQLAGKRFDELDYLNAHYERTRERLQNARSQLRSKEASVRKLIEEMPIGIAVADADQNIEYINAELEKDLQIKSHKMIGKSLSVLKINNGIATTSSGTTIAVKTQTFDLANQHVLAVQNIQEKMQAEQQRQAYIEGVRDQLRAPLLRLSTYFARIDLTGLNDNGRQQASRMGANIDRLLSMINDLFDLDTLDSDDLRVEIRDASLIDILDRTQAATSALAASKKVQLRFGDLNCNPNVKADPDRIIQALINLVGNAIKFSHAHSFVDVTADRLADDTIVITVTDQGRGIPKDKLAEIFEPYKQVEGSDASEKGGAGLGLAICKKIITAHGGAITVDSEFGKGSCFTIKWPAMGTDDV